MKKVMKLLAFIFEQPSYVIHLLFILNTIIGVAPITLRAYVIKLVTFKGGHPM